MRNILLGVSGGIGACKSVLFASALKKAGFCVQVILSEAAQKFVTPLSFQALTHERVWQDFDQVESAMGHIELARWADLLLIAPSTAHTFAKCAHGHGSDLLSCLYLATTSPVVMVPAMNPSMWQHPAVQRNHALLQQDGVHFWGPVEGSLACGEQGLGRMMEVEDLLKKVQAFKGAYASA